MNNQLQYKDRWLKRVISTRREYFYHHLRGNISKTSLTKIFERVCNDIFFLKKRGRIILKQIYANGKLIKKNYGVSFISQFYRMLYLVLVLRTNPNLFRTHHLFKEKNWKNVKQYTFSHYKIQLQTAEKYWNSETDLFLNKFRFFEFCAHHNINTPEVFAVFENGEVTYPLDKEFTLPAKDVFIKERNGEMGIGAKKYSFINNKYLDKNQNTYSPNEILEYLTVHSKKTSVLVQDVIINHPEWQVFTPGALATCRIVTAKSPVDQSINPLFYVLRMPVGNSDIDNYAGGGIVSSVDFNTGRLGKAVGAKPINGHYEFDSHPDTHQKITGHYLPYWDDLLSFTIDLHKKVQSAFVGWDVCMTDKGCSVLEGSLYWNAGSFEIPYQLPMQQSVYPQLFEQWLDSVSNS